MSSGSEERRKGLKKQGFVEDAEMKATEDRSTAPKHSDVAIAQSNADQQHLDKAGGEADLETAARDLTKKGGKKRKPKKKPHSGNKLSKKAEESVPGLCHEGVLSDSILAKWKGQGWFVRFLNGNIHDCRSDNLAVVSLPNAMANIDSKLGYESY